MIEETNEEKDKSLALIEKKKKKCLRYLLLAFSSFVIFPL